MTHADIALCWISVHGGRYHALLHLRDRLRGLGLSCTVLLNSDAPLGLQVGVDVSPEQVQRFAQDGVHILPLAQLGQALKDSGARLCVFDSHEGDAVPRLIRLARQDMGALTAQASTLLADYTFHGADYALVQHPISLWFTFDYSRDRRAASLAQAKGIFFSGNIFYEPLLNTWTSDIRSREQFLAKYGLDASRPTLLWLPNREDGLDAAYGQILSQVREAGMNALVKLHPWEYKQLRHGFDPYGLGKTSAEHWGAPAMGECDCSWALAFCDAGLMRGSSMGLELPFWRKPGVYLPYPGLHAPWHRLLLRMTRGCSAHLDAVEGLGSFLRSAWPLAYADAAYDAAKDFTMPRGSGRAGQPDSLDLHARHLQAILAAGPAGRPQGLACRPEGSVAAVRRAYEPEIPPDFYRHLRRGQRLLHAARRFAGLRPAYNA